MRSSSARTPKLRLPAEQSLIGECCNPPKKDTLRPKAKEKLQQDGRRGTIAFKIKPHTHQRSLESTNKNSCTQEPGKGAVTPNKRLSQTCLWVFEGLLWRPGLAVAWHGDRDSSSSSPRRCGMRHQSSWTRLPLAPPQSHRVGNPKLENNYTKEVLALLRKF